MWVSGLDVKDCKNIGVLGATSLVGGYIILKSLSLSKNKVIAFTRKTPDKKNSNIEWRRLKSNSNHHPNTPEIRHWICAAPIWVLPDYFAMMEASGVKKIVALSSTSRFTKSNSVDSDDQIIADRLANAEAKFQVWAKSNKIDWAILRPTMIYSFSMDKNISVIARLIFRWRIFPLLGTGNGLRQPIHAEDAAKAFLQSLLSALTKNSAFNISGAEKLTYKEMVKNVFSALNKTPHFFHLPRWIFKLSLVFLHVIPRFRHVKICMADRMDSDLIFDHNDAQAAFGFSPRKFKITTKDLPKCTHKTW